MATTNRREAGKAPTGCTEAAAVGPGWRVEVIPAAEEPWPENAVSRGVWLFLALGLAARVVRYALRFPLWEDECFLSVNLIGRGFLDLTGPLDYYQVAPLLFLWAQRAVVGLAGFNEYALRLVPLVCGVASLGLFAWVARRLLTGLALLAGLAMFAVSYPPIRYAAEAKQYGGDLLAALVFAALLVAWYQGRSTKWLWAMVALTPLAVGFSYPAVFVGAGASVFVAVALLGDRSRRGWGAWIVLNLVLAGSFAGLFALSARHQSQRSLAVMQECWKEGFPPVGSPGKLLVWLLDAHTSDMLAYPVGGHHGGSSATLVLCLVGLAVLARRRQGALVLLLLGPLAWSLLAAALHRYPYGQMTKFQIYMAPAICLLAGIGIAALTRLRYRSRAIPRLPAAAVLGLLAALGAGSIVRDFLQPYKSVTVMRARDFARWFWFTAEFEGEVVCLKTDLGLDFSPATYNYGLSCLYLCNQKIYSPRHARGEPPRWERISAEWPLRCVEYRGARQPYDHQAASAWLETMQKRYRLVSRERFPFVNVRRLEQPASEFDYVEVYRFVPK